MPEAYPNYHPQPGSSVSTNMNNQDEINDSSMWPGFGEHLERFTREAAARWEGVTEIWRKGLGGGVGRPCLGWLPARGCLGYVCSVPALGGRWRALARQDRPEPGPGSPDAPCMDGSVPRTSLG